MFCLILTIFELLILKMEIDIQQYKEQRLMAAEVMKLLSKAVVTDNDCWEWVGHFYENGYGRVHYKGKHERAHRLSYLFHKGPITNNLLVCHTCDNPKCINPDHLFLGTNKDNMDDADAKGRYHQKFQPGGIPPNSKFTKEEVRFIRSQVNVPAEILALRYNVSISTIKNIKAGRSFKNV